MMAHMQSFVTASLCAFPLIRIEQAERGEVARLDLRLGSRHATSMDSRTIDLDAEAMVDESASSCMQPFPLARSLTYK
jgi:hypothetical protein